MNAWGDAWGQSWGESWGSSDQPVVEQRPDGGSVRRRRKPARRLDTYRTPEDIRREQLETERYLASLEKPQQATTAESPGREPEIRRATAPAAQPILADVAARAASAVQAKLEEAASAAALGRQQERRRTLALLLALD